MANAAKRASVIVLSLPRSLTVWNRRSAQPYRYSSCTPNVTRLSSGSV